MRRLGLLVIAVVLSGCSLLSNQSGVRPEQVTVYVAGDQPRFDSTTHGVLGHFAVTGGGDVSVERFLRNVRAEAAGRGAEYVVVTGANSRKLSQGEFERAAPLAKDPATLIVPVDGVFAVAYKRR